MIEKARASMQQEAILKMRRIRQVSVTHLFGTFNHTIPLNMDERITIIHGPNGFGKTMMLKLLHELFSPNNHLLRNIPFNEFRVDFEDDTSFWVNKTISLSTDIEEHTDRGKITLHATGEKSYTLRPKALSKTNSLTRVMGKAAFIQLEFGTNPEIVRNAHLWEDVEEFDDQLSVELLDEKAKTPTWLIEMRNSVPLRFIETQRLLSYTRPSPPKRGTYERSRERSRQSEYAVTEDSRHLIEIIGKKLTESASLSQSLDRTFPVRLLNPTAEQLQVTENDLVSKLKELEEKRSQLMATGLLDKETGTDFPAGYDQGIEQSKKAVLAVYAEDTKQKLGIFDELAQKIKRLTTIINSRFLYKTMTIDKEEGLVFTSDNGTVLPLENLSSGEQHELVLFYELLFRVTPGSLILIDEPELSLHIVWQEHFLKDVQQVAELSKIDIILATHSPDIINDRRDLVIELEAPKHGGL